MEVRTWTALTVDVCRLSSGSRHGSRLLARPRVVPWHHERILVVIIAPADVAVAVGRLKTSETNVESLIAGAAKTSCSSEKPLRSGALGALGRLHGAAIFHRAQRSSGRAREAHKSCTSKRRNLRLAAKEAEVRLLKRVLALEPPGSGHCSMKEVEVRNFEAGKTGFLGDAHRDWPQLQDLS